MNAEIAKWLEDVPKGELIAINVWDDDPEIFLVGILLQLTETTAKFQMIDTNGVADEIDAIELERIHGAHRNSEYLRSLLILRGNQEEAFKNVEPAREARAPRTIRAALQKAASDGSVIRYWTQGVEGSTYAAVKSVGEEMVALQVLVDGVPDGEYILKLDLIRKLTSGGRETRASYYLWQCNHGK